MKTMSSFQTRRRGRLPLAICAILMIVALLVPAPLFAQLPPVEPPFPCPFNPDSTMPRCPIPPWLEPPSAVTPVDVELYQVNAQVDGAIASVSIKQILRNDSAQVAEGVYLFPLPADASASSLSLEIDGEMVEGSLYNAGEARAIYETIVRNMRDPALLEWIDSGLFQISVFPIPAGESRTVELTYEQPVTAQGGLNHLVIPLRAYATGAGLPQTISVNVELVNQDGLRTIYSPSHEVDVARSGNDGALVGFEGDGADSQSDFSLYWGSDASAIGANLISYKPAGQDGYFLLLVAPSIELESEEVIARDIVVVLDVSGSMQGDKIEQARSAVDYVVQQLNPGDHFNLITFSTGARLWKNQLQPVSDASIEDAQDWVARIRASGSTDINRALLEAMAQLEAGDDERPAYLLFLTDGLPTQGETDTGDIVDNALDAADDLDRTLRLFTFGVGYDVNTDLLDTLSSELGGRSTYVKPDQAIDEVVGDFYDQIGKPVLANVDVDLGEAVTIDELYPYPLPDLFAGEQLLVTGRYREGGDAAITLSGEVNGRETEYTYPDQVLAEAGGDPFVARLWATRKMGALLSQIRREGANQELIDAVVELSLAYGIMSPYTSWLVLEPGMDADFEIPSIEASGGLVPSAAAPRLNADANALNMLSAAAEMPASGEEAVEAAVVRNDLYNATNVQQNTDLRYVAGKTFVQRGWTEDGDGRAQPFWVDTAWDGEAEPEVVAFASDRYFELAAESEISQWLAVSPEMVLVLEDGTVVRITTTVEE